MLKWEKLYRETIMLRQTVTLVTAILYHAVCGLLYPSLFQSKSKSYRIDLVVFLQGNVWSSDSISGIEV